MTTFGLVHGAAHGAWCWERLTPLLEAAGHRVVVMDLPCEEPNAGCVAYADVVTTALGDAHDVVLVGHSLGGLTIPLVAARRPVKRLVFLCALLPLPGSLPFGPDPAAPAMSAPGFETDDLPDGTFTVRPDMAARFFYGRCSAADAAWAISHLRRQSRAPHREICPLTSWPDVERVYLAARDDRCVTPEYGRYVARARAGLAAIEIDGDHSPFLSAPDELARVLRSLV